MHWGQTHCFEKNFYILTFFKLLLAAALVLAFLLSLQSPASAKGNPKYASIVMDADTGMILHQRYADKSLHPASLTKVMTLLMAFEAIDQGRLSTRDRIRISRHATNMVPSKLDLPSGSTIAVEDAIYALVTKSANDIAVAMAEHLGGTESNFARMMTRKAHQLGMSGTIFRNASGLHDDRQVTTARDMAKMAHYVITKYPRYYEYFSTANFTYNGRSYHNHNRLMKTYAGMDGMKTGYVQASGFNLIASAVRKNRRLIGVVFGGRSAATRNAHMATLLDEGFAKMADIRVASANVPVPARKPAVAVALAALSNLNATAPASGKDIVDAEDAGEQKWAALNPALESGMFGRLIGEGDYDPSVSKRIETGLLAISALKGETLPKGLTEPQNTPKTPKALRREAAFAPWSIQIGAFLSRAATDTALNTTIDKLPPQYRLASRTIAPLKTNEGWLYRARLSGYSKTEAFKACSYIDECIPVAP